MIQFEGVTKLYRGSQLPALLDISLSIEPGEFITLVGHTGAGKTTFLKLILVEEQPTSGKVSFDGVDLQKQSYDRLSALRRSMGTIFQDIRLLPNKTVAENVAFALEIGDRSDLELVEDVPHALDLVGLRGKADRFPHQLSGGEKQRLALARAIIAQPKLILADEPTGNLDPEATFHVVEILKKINELGSTVILATHNREIVNAIARRVITLEDGKMIFDNKTGTYILDSEDAEKEKHNSRAYSQKGTKNRNTQKDEEIHDAMNESLINESDEDRAESYGI